MGEHNAFVSSGDTLEAFLPAFWTRQVATAEDETPDFKHPSLPLARIKKVMKSDPDVKMISADAPILFAKACEIFISEITARAWIVAESNKRRTLSRTDIARAISKSDQFDFLIDIIPREEKPPLSPTSHPKRFSSSKAVKGEEGGTASTSNECPPQSQKGDLDPSPSGEEQHSQHQDMQQTTTSNASNQISPPYPPPQNEAESNVFYRQIQTYLHAPQPAPHSHPSPPPPPPLPHPPSGS